MISFATLLVYEFFKFAFLKAIYKSE